MLALGTYLGHSFKFCQVSRNPSRILADTCSPTVVDTTQSTPTHAQQDFRHRHNRQCRERAFRRCTCTGLSTPGAYVQMSILALLRKALNRRQCNNVSIMKQICYTNRSLHCCTRPTLLELAYRRCRFVGLPCSMQCSDRALALRHFATLLLHNILMLFAH